MNARGANLEKSQRRVKSVRRRIGRPAVDLADDARVASRNGMSEQIVVQPARMAVPACGGGDHNAVHIDKARIARAEPEEIRTVVACVLVERQQEGVEASYSPRQERLFDQMLQPRRLEPGQLLRMVVVER